MDNSPVNNSTKSTWATVLTTIGMVLGPGGGVSIPAGLPVWVGLSIALLGSICYGVGNQLKHSVTAAVATQSNDTSFIVKTAVPTQTPLPASVAQSTPPTPKTV